MRGPKPTPLALCADERTELEQLVRRHTTPQQIALRARIVLASAAGANNSHIARQEGVHVDTVRLWRNRWLACAAVSLDDLPLLDRLSDMPRPGAPIRITAEQVCRIIELACEAPYHSDRPISHWSEREIADEVRKRGIVSQISDPHAARLLKRGICNPTAGATG